MFMTLRVIDGYDDDDDDARDDDNDVCASERIVGIYNIILLSRKYSLSDSFRFSLRTFYST